MAAIKARRRPIREGAARKNEATCRISPIPLAPAKQAFRKMVRSVEMARSGGTVEGAAKIATGVPPDGRLTVDLFPWLELPGSNFLREKPARAAISA
jgi:hypothetical protein